VIVDFQHHYTPPELQAGDKAAVSVQLDERGAPKLQFNPLLADIEAHVRMMDRAGIDAAVLSCGLGYDQPDLGVCRLINDDLAGVERRYPGRFIGLAHVPAMNGIEAVRELKRCAVELGFPGVVIGSEMRGQALDAEALRPFWKAAADLGLYVFVHPLQDVIAWNRMDADDLGRMLGWEFSLMTAAVRLINGGLLDQFPGLNVQFAHFAGGIGRYMGRIRGFQEREQFGSAAIPGHNRRPAAPIDHYVRTRLFYDCAGWADPLRPAVSGAEWVRFGLSEVPRSQVVFATDYPQAVRTGQGVVDYVAALRALGSDAQAVLAGANAERLIPDLRRRLEQGDRRRNRLECEAV
jgi:predicted TIM-barrel fold metal-dependent hydrolase